MTSARPNLEGLFNGSTAPQPPMTWLNGSQPAEQADPPPAPPAAPPSTERAPAAGLLDPVALAERYFEILQTLLDLQRQVGLRLAHQVAQLLPGIRPPH